MRSVAPQLGVFSALPRNALHVLCCCIFGALLFASLLAVLCASSLACMLPACADWLIHCMLSFWSVHGVICVFGQAAHYSKLRRSATARSALCRIGARLSHLMFGYSGAQSLRGSIVLALSGLGRPAAWRVQSSPALDHSGATLSIFLFTFSSTRAVIHPFSHASINSFIH